MFFFLNVELSLRLFTNKLTVWKDTKSVFLFECRTFIVVDALSFNWLVHSHATKLKQRSISTNHDRLKNPNWREADQLATYKHDRGDDLGPTAKQLQLSGQSGASRFQVRRQTTRPRCLPVYVTGIIITGL